MTNLLYSVHDRDSHPIMPAGGWCVDAVLVTDTPPNYAQIRSDINWIVRLNHGWHPNGTIPLRSGYAEYAKRCADFVQRSKGVDWFIISNEPNHAQELPHGVRIIPDDYSDCFNACYAAIKTLRRDANVGVAAIAPWDITSGMDWLAYYRRMLDGIDECNFLALHGYTHGADPDLIWSYEKSAQGWYWHFPTIIQQLDQVPVKFSNKPVHVTETNQGDNAWADTDSGWVVEAYEAINTHNNTLGRQMIHSLSLYRWRGDKWEIHNKPQVQADFRAAVSIGYESPILPDDVPPFEPESPWEPGPEPEPTPPPSDDYLVQWDPRLDERGTTLAVVASNALAEWHVRIGSWYDEQQAQGRHNVFVSVLDEHGDLLANVPVRFFWDDGQEVKNTEYKHDPWLGHDYSLDFAMYNPAPAYSLTIADEEPSDLVSGLGLGDLANPQHNIHTSYFFEFQRIATKPLPPPPPHTEYCIEPRGANLRDAPVDGEILITVPYRHAVTAAGEVEGSDGWMWQECTYGDYSGYIRSDLISPKQPATIVPQPPQDNTLIWPTKTGIVTQFFGDTSIDYSKWGIPAHDGIDIACDTGTPVYCVGHGRVVAVGDDPEGFGLFVRIYHEADGFHSLYGHLSRQMVYVGDLAVRGKQIGEVGSTGNSSGPHLHFSFRVGSEHDYYRVHTGHKQGASDPMAIYAVVNRSDPNLLVP